MATDGAPSRTLIFGGTFDPPHIAHIELPQAAARELTCDRILYIPAAVNPLKSAPGVPPPTSAEHRLAMLRLALRDSPNTDISTVEIDRARDSGGPSFTIDTLRALKLNEASTTYLLIGADQALDFHRWREWRTILRLVTPAVMLRPPWTMRSYAAALRQRYDEPESKQWESRTLGTLPMRDVSATEIRRRLAAREPCNELMAPAVADYIQRHGLYSALSG